ncbi:MAG TPA: HAMP domain-containing sensor histidine kinase [Galbitalea sp.]|nr:HAMP domain-containing sensor histidine kinase [Galbitalea sp.]
MSWLRGQTIRWRITLWAVFIAIVLVSAAAFAFRAGVDTIVASSTHTLLTSNGAGFEGSIRRGTTEHFSQPGEDQLVAVVNPDGKVMVSSLPDSLEDRVRKLVRLDHGLQSVMISPNLRYDVVNEPVTVSDGTWHIIEARNSDSGQEVLNGLTFVLAIGVVLLVIGFGVSTWIVSGFALRPVSRMREQASRLSHAATADTLPVGPVRDELSALAETLNDFILSVRSSADRERQMIADASHELRTPVAVLRTQLQLAHLSTGDASALEKEITAAEGTLDRLSNLTTNLLTLSRIEAEAPPPLTSGELLLAEFLRSMDRAIVLGSTRAVSVDFTNSRVRPAVTAAIRPVDFAGLVDNLVSNAIGASPRGSAVTVDLVQVGDKLVLTVLDAGHGMSEEFRRIAFDRFSRASSSPHAGAGSGLGLAIVKAIVVRSGGDVRLESRAEGGLRAIVELPLVVE